MTEVEEQRDDSEELLDEESLAVLAILLAVSLEFGFGFAKTVDWWAASSPARPPSQPSSRSSGCDRLMPGSSERPPGSSGPTPTGPTVAGGGLDEHANASSSQERAEPRAQTCLARGGSQDPAAKRLRRLHRRGAWLVSAGYTTPAKLVSRGNSNGGLLVAVTAMQAPDAFGAVFSRVPTLDMLRIRERRPSNSARPTIPSRARISPDIRRITTSERSPLSRDDVRVGIKRPGRATARSAQDGRQAPG